MAFLHLDRHPTDKFRRGGGVGGQQRYGASKAGQYQCGTRPPDVRSFLHGAPPVSM
jgi:hypothetical protein